MAQRMSSDETGSIEPYDTPATPVVTTVIPAYLGTDGPFFCYDSGSER